MLGKGVPGRGELVGKKSVPLVQGKKKKVALGQEGLNMQGRDENTGEGGDIERGEKGDRGPKGSWKCRGGKKKRTSRRNRPRKTSKVRIFPTINKKGSWGRWDILYLRPGELWGGTQTRQPYAGTSKKESHLKKRGKRKEILVVRLFAHEGRARGDNRPQKRECLSKMVDGDTEKKREKKNERKRVDYVFKEKKSPSVVEGNEGRRSSREGKLSMSKKIQQIIERQVKGVEKKDRTTCWKT